MTIKEYLTLRFDKTFPELKEDFDLLSYDTQEDIISFVINIKNYKNIMSNDPLAFKEKLSQNEYNDYLNKFLRLQLLK